MKDRRPALTAHQLFWQLVILTIAYMGATIIFYPAHPIVSCFLASLGFPCGIMALHYRKSS